MHYEYLVARIAPLHILAKDRIGSALTHLVVAHREQPVALVYHDYVIVLIDELDAPVVEHAEFAGEIDPHLIAGSKRVVKLCDW